MVADTLAPLTCAVSPVEALRRIAFLLERQRASTYRVEAFRKAVGTLRGLAAGELERLLERDELQSLAGVGSTTAAVISQAASGALPDYLQQLQTESSGALAEGGADLRAALRGDCHMHSNWSDGGSPIEEMALTAAELDHEYVVLTDHSPRLKVANGLSRGRLLRQLKVIDQINAAIDASFRLLRGIEVDILDDGSLDQDDDILARLDLVVASVHSKLRMERGAMTRRMLRAVRHPRTNVLGHCTGQLVTGSRGQRPPSEFDAAAVFAACAENNVAVEINSRPERSDPPDELITMALQAGCLFTIDSDAHAPGQLDMKAYGCERAQRLGIPQERIVNTWPLEQLLAWTAKAALA